jgi:aminopeptidase N/puromycin-sensitive aminopeptidase
MRKLFLSTLLFGFAAISAVAQRLPGNAIPEHYQIQLNPNLATATYEGDETIDVRLPKATSAITLNALELDFKTVDVTSGGATQPAKVSLDPKNEMATLTVEKPVSAGPAKIHIVFSGKLNDQLRGFYLGHTDKRTYASTQMEPTDARRAFPCFDEPALKATFDMSVIADKGDVGISNGKVVSDTPGPGADKHTIKFATSPKMSSYLVALVVGDFKCLEGSSDGIPIRVCGTPDKVQDGQFALETAEHAMHFYNQYYSIKYPYGKLDLIGLPDFSAGAMENIGAITFREIVLDVNKDTPESLKKIVADDIAHEMAHQWFGDLVTMEWWNDIWLNEGFATWMSPKPVNAWKPEWNNRMDEVQSADNAMSTDSLKSTRPIRTQAETSAQIGEMFEPSITYDKTANVLRMVEQYIGPESFRAGVNAYLEKYKYGNATAEDFWNTMTSVSHRPVDKIMSTFVEQPGVPLVTVTASCKQNNSSVHLGQQRFFRESAAMKEGSPELWNIPVCLRNGQGKQCELLAQRQQDFSIKGCSPWTVGNADAYGYYRTEYAPANLSPLVSGAESILHPDERLALISDQWSLMRADRLTIADYLRVAHGLSADRDRAIWEDMFGSFQFIHDYLVTPSDRPQFEAWVRELVGPLVQDLGWQPSSNDSADLRTLRSEAIDALAYSGNDTATQQKATALAEQTLRDPSKYDADLTPVFNRIAALHGEPELYDRFLAMTKSAKSVDQYYQYLFALTSFRDPKLVERNLQMVLTPEIRNQDATGFLGAIMTDPITGQQAWEFLKAHWDQLGQKLASYQRDAIVGATSGFCSASERDDVSQFFSAHAIPNAQRTLKQSLERMNSCINTRSEQSSNLESFLSQQNKTSAGMQ